ncbi:hypothetical protein AAE02nite_38700 [Adhaeribacter aerolatus]|uniref:Uncharacterized protein n=1 Tax=Adhaeribacter aerolatus TaxID=670289 RepID=A0A512B2K7_9BACT|nr:hypothetical protein AAE02nite_38700 [Adhaeribacter aerolatus]
MVVGSLALTSCRNGKIPCPKFGTDKNFGLFKVKSAATKPGEAPLGERVAYGKDGLLKKNKYKYLRNKPKRKKYRNR